MDRAKQAIPALDQPTPGLHRLQVVGLWLLSGILLFTVMGLQPVTRTQEARVLETSREMWESGGEQWLIPRANGNVRLRKPPLVYWITAATYGVFGVSKWSGRLPAALATWLTLGIICVFTAGLFNRRAALLATAFLLGNFAVARFGSLAETDTWVALLVTLSIYSLWRGFEQANDATRQQPQLRQWAWFHLSALLIGLTALAKGPPAAYPILFFILLCIIERRYKPLLNWLRCGAAFTMIVIAAPWFIYARRHPEFGQIVDDLSISASGAGHGKWFYVYLYQLPLLAAPWTPLIVAALYVAIERWRQDARLRMLLIWLGSILLPLFLWGNKQAHYLLPAIPPLMILTGWLVDAALRPQATIEFARAVRKVWLTTLIVCFAAPPLVIVAALKWRGSIGTLDWLIASATAGVIALVFSIYRRSGFARAILAQAGLGAAAVILLFGVWAPLLRSPTVEDFALRVRLELGDGPYAFRNIEHLPLSFALRSVIPTAGDGELAQLAAANNSLVVLEESDGPAERLPGFSPRLTVLIDGKTCVAYVPAGRGRGEGS